MSECQICLCRPTKVIGVPASTSFFWLKTTANSHPQRLNMSLSPLTKIFLPSVIVSIAVFSAMSLPLAAIGSEQVVIKLHEDPVFQGKVRDVASPYLALATLLSAVAGIATASTLGWRQSARQSDEYEQQVSSLQQYLKEKEQILKEIKLSQPRLQAFGLGAFLEDEGMLQPINHKPSPVSQPAVMQTPVLVPVASAPALPAPTTVQAATAAFASAQSLRAYGHTMQQLPASTEQTAVVPGSDMQKQLQEMIAQMQAIQSALQVNQPTVATVPASFYIESTHPAVHQVQFLDRQTKKIAS